MSDVELGKPLYVCYVRHRTSLHVDVGKGKQFTVHTSTCNSTVKLQQCVSLVGVSVAELSWSCRLQ